MDVKVYLNDGEVIEGEGNIDEMGVTLRIPSTLVLPGKENEASMVMVPWPSINKFEYVVTQAMIDAQTQAALLDTPHAELQPNRAQRRAANRG